MLINGYWSESLAASLYAGFPEVAYLNGLLIAAWTLVRTATLPRPGWWPFLLRVGIGAAPQAGSVDYVLGRFFEEERPLVDETIGRAAQAVKCAIDNGLLSAMNLFNKNPET